MAGFFSLGGSSSSAPPPPNNINNNNNPPQDPNPNNEINPESFYLYHPNPTTRNLELTHNYPYNKGTFDLWQNPPPPQQHRQNPLMLQDFYSVAVGSTTARGGGSGVGGGVNIYDDHLRSGVVAAGGGGGGFMMMGSSSTTSSGSGTISCQDCGNQAKKDCVHGRCRSCCKSQGFECTTHVKSTWVPAAKRRERQQQIMTNTISSRDNYPQQIPKRVRDNKSSFPSSSNPSASGMELGNLPAEVNSTAVFRCVRVSSIDNTEDQFAYQTAVNIGGRTFKGILYDQGLDNMAGDTSSGVSRNISQLNLTAATSTSTSSPGTTPTASQFLESYQSAPHFMADDDWYTLIPFSLPKQ